MEAKPKGNTALGLNSGVFNSSIFNNTSFASFSNLQDFPFFESLASLGDLSALGAAFQQSSSSIPEHLLAQAAAAQAASAAAAGQQGGSSANLPSLNLGRNDSFSSFTQSSLLNLPLFLSEVEQGVLPSSAQPGPPQPQQAAPQPLQSPTLGMQSMHHSQQAQPLPAAAVASYGHAKGSTSSSSSSSSSSSTSSSSTQQQPMNNHHHQHVLPSIKPGPTPIAPAPSYPSPAQFAAFASSMHIYPPLPPHVAQQQAAGLHTQPHQPWGPTRPGAQAAHKLPLTPSPAMMMAQSPGAGMALTPIGNPMGVDGGVAVPQEFSSTLYSLASTLPPPVVLSNDSVLGSVGGGLHFQRHCVRRRMPDDLPHTTDPNVFFN